MVLVFGPLKSSIQLPTPQPSNSFRLSSPLSPPLRIPRHTVRRLRPSSVSRRCLKSSIRTAELALEHVTRARPGTERVRHFWRVFWCPVSF